jgi:Sec-independent protein secretion pathway component TatC
MTLVEHLVELRRRVVVSILAIAIGGAIAFALYGRILSFFIDPYCQVVGRRRHRSRLAPMSRRPCAVGSRGAVSADERPRSRG